ncbi:hypothetical protein QZH41_020635, partial [Actinostola sp. cb2023]
MEDEKLSVTETSKVESSCVSEDKPRLEPLEMDVDPAKDEEEKAGDDHSEAELESLLSKQLTDQDRLVLFEKAVRKNLHVLFFNVLISDETAIQFAQAEKLYYETALITVNRDDPDDGMSAGGIDGKSVDNGMDNTSSQQTPTATSEQAQKAEEYEKLAHMCLKQQNPQLALDYCAKAVKLQQSCFGEQHPITLQTLDLFTVIYAEMGKQQYKAALDKFSAAQEKESQAKQSQNHTQEKEHEEDKTEEVSKQTNDQPVNVAVKTPGDGENQPQSNP